MNVLVTGGAGYIGSHAALRLLEEDHAVTIVDDLSAGHRQVIDILSPLGDVQFVQADIADRAALAPLLKRRRIDGVFHFAAVCSVAESVRQPLRYWRVNVGGTLALVEAIREAGVARMVFSSSAATYGAPAPQHLPIREDCPQHPINPYGWSKLAAERMLLDVAVAEPDRSRRFGLAILRYFNVAGCDHGDRLGEDHDPETHLIPVCLDAALGKAGAEPVTIFGTDYDTPDGTCIRDYVHVEDLVDAHLAALNALRPGDRLTCNVGIGRGYSVREVVDACRAVTGVRIEVAHGLRREGDPPSLFADVSKIKADLRWSARTTDLRRIVDSAWRWRRAHPNGYGSPRQGGASSG